MNTEDTQKKSDSFNTALAAIHYCRASEYSKSGAIETAVQECKTSLEFDPHFEPTSNLLKTLKLEQKSSGETLLDRALRALDEEFERDTTSINSNNAINQEFTTYPELVYMSYLESRYPNQLDAYGHPLFRKELMRLFLAQKRWSHAEHLIPVGDNWHEILFARAYSEQGDQKRAKQWWERVLVADPRSEEASKALALLNQTNSKVSRHSLPGELVLSLTSYPPRFNDLAKTIRTLCNQSVTPDRIILWIAHEDKDKLTDELLDLDGHSIEISYCNDIKSFKKIIPTLKKYPDAFIVTADDDINYDPHWLEELTSKWNSSCTNVIIAHRVRNIILDQQAFPVPYVQWPFAFNTSQPSSLNFVTSGGGALFPPRVFHSDVTNEKLFLKLCPNADDLWLYWMAQLAGAQTISTGKYTTQSDIITWPGSQAISLWNQNVTGNDTQIFNLIGWYGFPLTANVNKELLQRELNSGTSADALLTPEMVVGLQKEHDLIKEPEFKTVEERVLHMVHTKAYETAARLLTGKKVLDLGCNTGYGTNILSTSAESIIGVDVSGNAIAYARQKYPSIKFEQVDGQKLPFQDKSFDYVVSFQVIEHVANHEGYISELKRVLKDDGAVIFTTPNASYRLEPGVKPWNRFHVREFKYRELKSLLSIYFSNSKVLGLFAEKELHAVELRRVCPNLSNPARDLPPYARELYTNPPKKLTVEDLNQRTTADFFYLDEEIDSAIDMFSICSDGDITTQVATVQNRNSQICETAKLIETINSGSYWESRYSSGGNSGAGSYGRLAEFKAEIINAFTSEHQIDSVIEYGVGDGNQLKLAHYPRYHGFDVSHTAVERCRATFKADSSKLFSHVDDYANETAHMTMSLDVIFHLVEDHVYNKYMHRLFDSSEEFVIIYASNDDSGPLPDAAHVRHRHITQWVENNKPEWKMIGTVANRYPYQNNSPNDTSFADFFFFERK